MIKIKQNISLAIILISTHGFAITPPPTIFEKLESLNQMRESLAATLDSSKSEITEQTFQAVCMPVGKELKRWGEEMGYQVKQLSHKNRNPLNALRDMDQKTYNKFQADSKLKQIEVSLNEKDLKGTAYYYRIPVAQSCLHCHGEKEKRPDFIKAKYLNDKAFDFKASELRGVYWVFKPELKK
jgi:hypothetical protein